MSLFFKNTTKHLGGNNFENYLQIQYLRAEKLEIDISNILKIPLCIGLSGLCQMQTLEEIQNEVTNLYESTIRFYGSDDVSDNLEIYLYIFYHVLYVIFTSSIANNV